MEKTEQQKQIEKEINQSMIKAIDDSYDELVLLINPIMNNKIKYINGVEMIRIKKQIEKLVQAHQHIRKYII